MSHGNPKTPSPLVLAAAALDDELRAYDALAEEGRHTPLNTEKGLERVLRVVRESTARNDSIQEKLRGLVAEIEEARLRQVGSLEALLEAARAVQARTEQREGLRQRFATLGESAAQVNTLANEVSAKREGGASDDEVLEGIGRMQNHMAGVVSEAEGLAALAAEQDWPDLARQADAVRQQVHAVKNKLALAQRAVASRASS
jgi:hypothetical protein